MTRVAILLWLATLAGCYALDVLLSGCIVEGTLVATPRGPRAIETLLVADTVWSRAPDGRPAVGTVLRVHRSRTASWRLMSLESGETVRLTAEHPVATPRGWERAGDLSAGDSVQTAHGWTRVASAGSRAGRRRTFDLEVSPHANFFAAGLLVHNKSPKQHFGYWRGRTGDGTLFRIEIRRFGKGVATVGEPPQVFLSTSALPHGFRWKRFDVSLDGFERGAESYWIACAFTEDRIEARILDSSGEPIEAFRLVKEPESPLRDLRRAEPYASAVR